MKPYERPPLVKVIFAVLFLIPLFYLAHGLYEKYAEPRQIQNATEVQKGSHEFPRRLLIPAIKVNADIQHVGVNPAGEMEVPSNTVDVAWFKLGPRPGENGSAVLSGHVDGKNGKDAVFTNLYKLKEGDKLYVKEGEGKSLTFVVREKRIYDPGYAEEVFSQNDKAHLNLITCDGIWDGAKKSYSKRLVVFADILN